MNEPEPNSSSRPTSLDSSTISLSALHALDRQRRRAAGQYAEAGTRSARRQLHLCLRHRQELEKLAETSYPYEACGLLVGTSVDRQARVLSILQVRNLAATRPQRRYRIDPAAMLDTWRRAQSRGRDVVGVWYSHPDYTPVPSSLDLESAWQGFSYLILGVAPTGSVEMRAWRLDGEIFVEEEIVVAAEFPWDLDGDG